MGRAVECSTEEVSAAGFESAAGLTILVPHGDRVENCRFVA
jgi:hypothetical protein